MARDKHRIRFQKAGTLRLVSHHDLKRCFERMLRRADLPFASTEGFHPQPRIVFGLSLALGLVGRDEVADLLLTEEMDPAQVHERLARQAPPGLDILHVKRVDPRCRILARLATYSLPLPPERRAGLAEGAAELLAQSELWYERTRPQPRRVNVRPYLSAVRIGPDAVEIDITVTPTGTARPEEVFGLLGLEDVLEAGAVMERTRLDLHDGPSPANGPAPTGDPVDEPPQDFFADSQDELQQDVFLKPLAPASGERGASGTNTQDDNIPPPAPSGAAPPRG